MKILSCHVENFGKLHNYDIDFKNGLNVICKENGWGKSTLAAFIRVMFYGFDGKGNSIERNERLFYKPWQTGKFGGQLSFEMNNKEYIINRVLKNIPSKDEFELRDVKTNKIFNYDGKIPNSIGERIFKINRDSFMRTVFIGQNDCSSGISGDIYSKISNLIDGSNDMNNFESAQAMLTKMINSMNRNRNSSIPKRQAEIDKYKNIIGDGNYISDQINKCKVDLQVAQEHYSALKKELHKSLELQNELTKHQSLSEKNLIWKHLQKTVDLKKAEMEDFQKNFIEGIPYLEEVDQKLIEYEKMNKAAERIKIYSSNSNKSKISVLKIGIAIVIIGIAALFVVSKTIALLIIVIGILLILIDILPDDIENQKNYTESKAEYESLKSVIYDFLDMYGYDTHDVGDQLKNIRDNIITYDEMKKSLSAAVDELENFEHKNKDHLILQSVENLPSLEELNTKITGIYDEIEHTKDLIVNLNEKLEQLYANSAEIEEMKLKLAKLEETQSKEIQKYDRLIIARQKLSDAKDSITAKYKEPLLKGFRKYYALLTSQDAHKLNFDKSMNIVIEEQKIVHELLTQSFGYKDLIWICLRIALVDAMYKNEKPILIMDDPFVNLDDEKAAAGRNLLERISENYQIIYFTCSRSRS